MLVTEFRQQVSAPVVPPQAQLLEFVTPADPLVGSVVRARRVFRKETSVVIGVQQDGYVKVVRPSGELSVLRQRKIKKTLAVPSAEVRSAPGRLHHFLNSSDAREFRTDAIAVAVSGYLDELIKIREHAVGLLLDRGPLSLSLSDCLAFPLEPWRVRYEFLSGSEASDEAAALATSLIADAGAPTEVRVLIALHFGPQPIKQYLIDEAPAPQSLPAEIAESTVQLREALYKPDSGILRDPLLAELLAVVGSDGQSQPSETLLADRSVWQLLLESGATSRGSGGPLAAEFAGLSALRSARNALFEWRWDEAKSIARDGLRDARREEVRDELLNIVACALWLQGEPEPALAALDTALEGAYTEALLINASVIATELEHDSAMDRLVRLAREAPTAQQRAVAAERALVLWDNNDDRVWEDADEDALPPEIRNALRTLIGETLPEDRYLRVLRVLANRDDEWLAAQRDAAFGTNAQGPVASIFRARAAGLDKYVKALATELEKGHTSDWVQQERDGIVEAATQVLLQRNDELPAAFFGMTLLEAKLPMKAVQGVALKCLTVASIAGNVGGEGGEPQLRFINWVEEANRDLHSLDADDRERVGGLIGIAAGTLTATYLVSRTEQLSQAELAWNRLCLQAAQTLFDPTIRLNMVKVKQGLAPIAHLCRETEELLARLKPLVDDYSLDKDITTLSRSAADLRRKVENPTLGQMNDTAIELMRNHRSGGFRP